MQVFIVLSACKSVGRSTFCMKHGSASSQEYLHIVQIEHVEIKFIQVMVRKFIWSKHWGPNFNVGFNENKGLKAPFLEPTVQTTVFCMNNLVEH